MHPVCISESIFGSKDLARAAKKEIIPPLSRKKFENIEKNDKK